MKKKAFAAIALTSCLAFSAAFTGCSLMSTNNKLDMEQVIATVDISQSDSFDESGLDKGAVTPTNIIKRELISYFLNVGYSYVQSGYSYEETFNSLVDALVNNAILVQYSTVELLKENPSVLQKFKEAEDKAKKYELLLDGDEINLATYKLYSSINSALDNYEQRVIEEEEGYVGSGTRTTPVNLNTEQDDYYPKKVVNGEVVLDDNGVAILDYGIYTGYSNYLLEDSGAYKDDALEKTTRSTRIKAYNRFLKNLRTNNLVDDSEKNNLTDILKLQYIDSENISQLESRIINKYYDLYEEQKEDLLKGAYINDVYNEVLAAQKANYGKSASAFDSAMSSMSSSSFILYSPDTSDSDWALDYGTDFAKYGFIYNILLPFDSYQSVQLSALKNIQSADGDDNYYFAKRNEILREIKTEDQRSVWFNGSTDYSFKPEESFKYYNGGDSNRSYLFFEDNLTDSEEGGRYKKLQAYDGRYSYNGQVIENEDESYTLIPNKLDIDDMLVEFKAYVDYVLDSDSVQYSTTPNYYDITEFNKADDDDEIDYSLFIYAEGKVDFGEYNSSNLMNPASKQYQAMSAVNELQFAYTTDTSVLSNYIGYSLTAYNTNYIKEFEYAAKKAVGSGVGSFAVCAGDYGWHLIYVTHVFEIDAANYSPDWSKIDEEGTFENLFYEWVKSNDLPDISSTRRTQILNDYNKDTTVTKYQSRYQDLLDLDKK